MIIITYFEKNLSIARAGGRNNPGVFFSSFFINFDTWVFYKIVIFFIPLAV